MAVKVVELDYFFYVLKRNEKNLFSYEIFVAVLSLMQVQGLRS